ncbi:MAG: DUF2383 domain-containing protein, partial [Pseudomonadota bacterium]
MTIETKMKEDALDAIEKAHARSVDAAAGFEKMAEKAELHFKDVASRFLGLHLDHAHRLAEMLKAHGRTPDPEGTFMGEINEAVVSMRAFFDEIDEDVMDQVRSGEEWTVSALKDAEEKAVGG